MRRQVRRSDAEHLSQSLQSSLRVPVGAHTVRRVKGHCHEELRRAHELEQGVDLLTAKADVLQPRGDARKIPLWPTVKRTRVRFLQILEDVERIATCQAADAVPF